MANTQVAKKPAAKVPAKTPAKAPVKKPATAAKAAIKTAKPATKAPAMAGGDSRTWADLKNTNDYLNKVVEQLQKDVAEAVKSRADMEKQLGDAKAKAVADLKMANDNFEALADSSEELSKNLKAKITAQEHEIKSVTDNLKSVSKLNDDRLALITKLQARVAELDKSNAEFRQENVKLKEDLAKANTANENLQATVDTGTTIIAKHIEDNAEAVSTIRRLNRDVENMLAEKRQLTSENSTLRANNDRLEQARARAVADHATQVSKTNSVQVRLDKVPGIVKSMFGAR